MEMRGPNVGAVSRQVSYSGKRSETGFVSRTEYRHDAVVCLRPTFQVIQVEVFVTPVSFFDDHVVFRQFDYDARQV